MKEITQAVDLLVEAKQVLLPNRYAEPFLAAYEELTGVEVPKFASRALTATSNGVLFRLCRGRDIPNLTTELIRQTGREDIAGLTGSEWALEAVYGGIMSPANYAKASDARFGRLCLIASSQTTDDKPTWQDARRFNPTPVVTALPNLTNAIGAIGSVNVVTGIEVAGAVENVAEALAMPGVDLVCSGETLRRNNMNVGEELMDVFPVVVGEYRQ